MTAQQRIAVACAGVAKHYALYPSRAQETLDALGLLRFCPWLPAAPLFPALRGVDCTIRTGERVAIIGRNGAGKSTLLKLISGNFRPSSGILTVNGRVSALLDLGLGVHEDLTGEQNIRSALAYNGLTRAHLQEAVADITGFCELGEFLRQPVRHYSSGMRARLYFALATALDPDILIIDEVLGAGDAYFAQKCAARIERLTGSGCTMLLVSHNLGQVAMLCDRAIWLEAGTIQADGPALEVISRYKEFTARLEEERRRQLHAVAAPTVAENWLRKQLLRDLGQHDLHAIPEQTSTPASALSVTLRTTGGKPARHIASPSGLDIVAERTAPLPETKTAYALGIFIFTADRRFVDRQSCLIAPGQTAWRLRYDPLLLGPGEYLVSAGLFCAQDPAVAQASAPDLSAASQWACVALTPQHARFEISHADHTETSLFLHPAAWTFESGCENLPVPVIRQSAR